MRVTGFGWRPERPPASCPRAAPPPPPWPAYQRSSAARSSSGTPLTKRSSSMTTSGLATVANWDAWLKPGAAARNTPHLVHGGVRGGRGHARQQRQPTRGGVEGRGFGVQVSQTIFSRSHTAICMHTWTPACTCGYLHAHMLPTMFFRVPFDDDNNNNNNKRPLTPKSMPPASDEHAKLKT